MKNITLIAAIGVTAVIVILSIAVNPDNLSIMMQEYGSEYVAGYIVGTFLLVLFFAWIVEKIANLRKPKERKQISD